MYRLFLMSRRPKSAVVDFLSTMKLLILIIDLLSITAMHACKSCHYLKENRIFGPSAKWIYLLKNLFSFSKDYTYHFFHVKIKKLLFFFHHLMNYENMGVWKWFFYIENVHISLSSLSLSQSHSLSLFLSLLRKNNTVTSEALPVNMHSPEWL